MLFYLFPFLTALFGQETYTITGSVLDDRFKTPVSGASVYIEEMGLKSNTDELGRFKLEISLKEDVILNIFAVDFVMQRIPISPVDNELDLGSIYLESDITTEQTDNLITLTDSELLDDGISSVSVGFLQATRDVFLNRAAFDFGQAFFRVRGYDSQNGQVLINGIPMNKFFDGRPQWNNWGGLNDVTRNQEFTNGLSASEYTFGGILGNTNITVRPSGLRPGTRLSSSFSNRTYAGRLMATYNSGLKDNGLAYAISTSRGWAKEGYIRGTLYDAYSLFGALEYRFNTRNTINLTAILASNRRGRSSAITEEVFRLAGKRYNPYWGEQNGKIRNSRERKIAEPLFLMNHYYESDKFRLNTGISYQFGTNARSRLGYYNGPNPDPTYYRYLPSFYVNSPIGANFVNANLAREGFLEDPQIDWPGLYMGNTTEMATYVLYDDTTDEKQLAINSMGSMEINDRFKLDFGVTYRNSISDNYAEIQDLLGADFHTDIDPFSDTKNDVNGPLNKKEGDVFNYHYRMNTNRFDLFAQLRFKYKRWSIFLAGTHINIDYQREGLFLNERFPENSLGRNDKLIFSNYSIKGGLDYRITARHWLTVHGGYLSRPPVLQNVFINPRENTETVPDILSETIFSTDLNYYIRLPKLTGRLTGFYTRFQNMTDVNFFFVDAGVGSDFVQEVITELDLLHMGAELGLEYQVSPAVKLSAVCSIGKQRYASNPLVSINFDTAGAEEDLINPDGNINLGPADIKDYKLAQGPQQAYAVGLEYRDPKYWWIGATANYLTQNYASISTITRTRSFLLDPDTGQPFPEATEENVSKLLAQRPLDSFYLLNLVGGKSWLKKGKYISVFVSINNVFDTIFRTGGFEQSRNGNFGQLQQDNLSDSPSFAPKYWYGYGRTYFLNLALSF
ncbi:TonB-dependent receptor [Ulvibacterium sp.]|uniref:TonB-dependent receptor n=1 Tax=Ulvibacterium sp. TaxID=2665914 RepID=UPI00262CB859|nr:TonB-dependent receptor [Ulvibacterium sp.]